MYEFIEQSHPEIFGELQEKKAIDAELEKKIKSALEDFKCRFKVE